MPEMLRKIHSQLKEAGRPQAKDGTIAFIGSDNKAVASVVFRARIRAPESQLLVHGTVFNSAHKVVTALRRLGVKGTTEFGVFTFEHRIPLAKAYKVFNVPDLYTLAEKLVVEK